MNIEKYGYWSINSIHFFQKYDALEYATKRSIPAHHIKFMYNDHAWKNFDRTTLGKKSLNSLYKERAQQLRDKYDYLILSYSGGSDSHNVLRTFIDNDIKLDEVYVKWPKPLMDGKFYTPNTEDRSAKNYFSEWDYSVKPTLKWLASKHPNIKITIKDYVTSPDSIDMDSVFEHANFVRSGALLLNSLMSDSEAEMISQGKTVGTIYGVDKPILSLKDDKIYMLFTDICLDAVGHSMINPFGGEPFYWSADFPQLAFEQAWAMSQYFKENLDKQKYMWNGDNRVSYKKRLNTNQFQNDVCRQVLYTTWDYRFQSDKPGSVTRSDKFFWLFESNEFERFQKDFFGNLGDRTRSIRDDLLTGGGSPVPAYKVIHSDLYYITDL